MAQVIKFASDIDGTEFATQSAQLAYDAGKRNEDVILDFADRNYPKATQGKTGPSRTIVIKALALWLSEQAALSGE